MQFGEVLAYSTDELPEQAALDKESRNFFGGKSSVNIPLMAGGMLIGVLIFDTLWEKRIFEMEEVNRLNFVADIFTSTLARKLTEERLIGSLSFSSIPPCVATQGSISWPNQQGQYATRIVRIVFMLKKSTLRRQTKLQNAGSGVEHFH